MKYPSTTALTEIIERLRSVLFPGYFEAGISPRQLLDEVLSALTGQIELAMPSQRAAEEIVSCFSTKIEKIKELLESDAKTIYSGDPAAKSMDEVILSYPGLYAVMVYRIAHEFYNLSVPLIPRMMSEHAHSVTGIDIHPGAVIGRNFYIDHGTGIVVGETSIIGDCVKIYQGVTIGALSVKDGQKNRGVKRHPTIKDNVTIYSGASVLGGETVIGENVVIGGGAFIIKSVPADTVVMMRSPELQFKSGGVITSGEFEQPAVWFYEI